MFTNSWQPKNLIEKFNVEQIHQVLKLIVVTEDQEDLARVRGILEQKQYYIDLTSSSHRNLEIVPKNCSKGNALKRLCAYLKISPESIVTIGDQKNDISMFDITPNSFTLATSLPSVQEHAKNVLDQKASFIVADAINRYIK
jgi:HAD superfamily hydrolase (TIGR01484 family)